MRANQIAITTFALWLFAILFFMLFTGRFDVALFFLLGFIGFLIIVELTNLRYVRPGYWKYIRFLIVAGIILSAVIIIQKAMEALGLMFIF